MTDETEADEAATAIEDTQYHYNIHGGSKQIKLHTFPAFEGFELNRRYRTDFRTSNDRDARRQYTLDVLAYAECDGERLDTIERVNNHLGTWRGVESVFYGVLNFNGVDLELSEEKARWFEHAGEELAASFVAAAASVMRPFVESVATPVGEELVARIAAAENNAKT